ncbi:hypothetical protein [Haloferula sp. A504]|uniref:hypothetical protein n=1 Tax=Haloferula sp. A504 TaxID=3373601 RepID=UPI0031C56655|nr:hypothetical protein [Verrucomicrobiaceae bacterium E54]
MIRVSITFAGLLVSSAMASSGAGDAALAFLERLPSADFDLRTRTAISPDVTETKLESIEQRLDRLGTRLEHGRLDVAAEKIDGKLAAVLISQSTDFDPATAQVHAVGLIRRDGAWLPAPVPASFENTGIRYHPELGPAATRLEAWMLEERPQQLQSLREGLEGTLLDKVRAALPAKTLAEAGPAELAELFLDACRKRDLPATAALIGGLEEPRPAGWRDSVSLIAAGLRSSGTAGSVWLELLDPRILRATVNTDFEEDRALVSIGFFDPTESRSSVEKIRIRNLGFRRSDSGRWVLRVPSWLGGDAPDAGPNLPVAALQRSFPLAMKKNAGDRAIEDPVALGEALMLGLASAELEPLLSLVHAETETAAAHALMSYSRLWRGHRDTAHLRLTLDVRTEGDRGCAVHCELNPFDPRINRNDISPILMVRGKDGWQLDPEAHPEVSDIPASLRPWYEECKERDLDEWLAGLGLEDRLGGLPASGTPEPDAARRAANAWIDALNSKDPRQVIARTTMFDDDRSVRRLFAFIGQELPAHNTLELVGMHENGRWAAASIRHSPPPGSDEDPIHLLHPIVGTRSGPKILAEAVLYIADTRARTFLNNEVWKRLGERLPQEAVDELEAILEAHGKLCQPAAEADE